MKRKLSDVMLGVFGVLTPDEQRDLDFYVKHRRGLQSCSARVRYASGGPNNMPEFDESVSLLELVRSLRSSLTRAGLVDLTADLTLRSIEARAQHFAWVKCSERMPELYPDEFTADRKHSRSVLIYAPNELPKRQIAQLTNSEMFPWRSDVDIHALADVTHWCELLEFPNG